MEDKELKMLIGLGDDDRPVVDIKSLAAACVAHIPKLAKAGQAVLDGGDSDYFMKAVVRYFNCNVCGSVCKGGHLRLPEYISPSALTMFRRKDKTEYFMRYLVLDRPDRMPQTKPMSVGSAFDAYVKHEISLKLGIKSDFTVLFESQVDVANRDYALEAGRVCMDAYVVSGAMADIITLLKQSDNIELELVGEGEIAVGGGTCKLLGKPDLKFTIVGVPVMLDWKVNGYCSAGNTSPKAGYIMCRDGWVGKQSRSHCSSHKDAYVMLSDGLMCNVADTFEELYPDWAMQVAPYGWMCGIPVGERHPAIIHQLACGPAGVRVAQHCAYISSDYQVKLAAEYCQLWDIINNPTLQWSVDEQTRLLRMAAQYKDDQGSEIGRIFAEMTREA